MIKGCSHNDEVDASTPGHPHLPRQFIPYFLARRLARKHEKNVSSGSSSPPTPASNHYGSPPTHTLQYL